MNDYSAYVPNVHFELIPIKNLVSNQDYQRSLSEGQVALTAHNFDVNQINPVKVSRRDGINYVFNGQHTIETVALASGSRETPVWCMIYDDLSYQAEAGIFANQMKYVRRLAPYEIFNANIEAGSSDQLMIRDLVRSFDLEIGNKKQPGMICAVSALESIYAKYGYHVLSRVLRICISTWEGDVNSLSACMLNAIARIVVVYNDSLNESLFIERLGSISVKQIIRSGKERGSGSVGYAEAMVIEYNGKKKTNANKLNLRSLRSPKAYLSGNASDESQSPKDGLQNGVQDDGSNQKDIFATFSDVSDDSSETENALLPFAGAS